MLEATFENRRVAQIENADVRVSVTLEGGHIAEILHKASGVNPLWIPPWRSIEISSYSPDKHPEFGNSVETRLLCGIMGHNLCLDMFGPPSTEEATAGMSAHGEAGLVLYDIAIAGEQLTARCTLPIAQIGFERRITLSGPRVLITERVTNLSPLDRPIAWTQHVTLGPPFFEPGITAFEAPTTQSQPIEEGTGYTAHLLDPSKQHGWFIAHSPAWGLDFGYVWSRGDFPWLGVWQENRGRTHTPWNGRTITQGMEFGVSPFPETRRRMIDRGELFETPCYRWLPANGSLIVNYYAAFGREHLAR